MQTTKPKKTRGNPIPLLREDHPEDYTGFEFITLIQYRDENLLTVVDNVYKKQIFAYVLDNCSQSRVDEKLVIKAVQEWDKYGRDMPLSVFAIQQIDYVDISSVYTSFSIDFVTRVIGPLPIYQLVAPKNLQINKHRNI